jgi:hypothetical protein
MPVKNIFIERASVMTKCYSLAKVMRFAEVVIIRIVNHFGVGQPVMRIGLDGREIHAVPAPAVELARAYWEGLNSSRLVAQGMATCLAGRITVSVKLLGEGKCLVPSGLRWPVDDGYRAVFDPKPHLLVLGSPIDDQSNVQALRRDRALEIDGFIGSLGIEEIRHQAVTVAQGGNHGVVVWFPHDRFLDTDWPVCRRFAPCVVGMDKVVRE